MRIVAVSHQRSDWRLRQDGLLSQAKAFEARHARFEEPDVGYDAGTRLGSRYPTKANRVHVHGFDDRQGDGLCDWHVGTAGPLELHRARLRLRANKDAHSLDRR